MSFVDPTQDTGEDQQDQSQVATAQQGASQGTQAQQSQQSASAPPPTSGAGGSGIVSGGNVGGGSSAPAATGGSDKPSTSGSWTNLNDYLNANQDQGAGVGQTIANTINTQGQNAQSQIQNLDQGFNQQVQNNTVAANTQGVNQAITDAQNNQLNDQDQTLFDQQATAQYNGPTDLTQQVGYGGASQAAAQALTTAGETQSAAGQDTLLQNQYNNASANGYTQGEQNLDQLLLSGSGGAQTLSNAANQWTGLQGQLTSDVGTDNAAAAAAAAETAATATAAQGAYTGANQTLDQTVQSDLANQQAGYSTDYNALVAALNGYNASGNLNVNANQAQMLGLTANEQLGDLYQASPNLGTQYLSQAAFNPLAEISQNQAAEMAALTKLGAGANLSDSYQSQFANDALAGTQNADNSINTSGFQAQVANAQTALNNAENQQMVGQGSQSFNYGYRAPSISTPFGSIGGGYINSGDSSSGTYTDADSLAQYVANGGATSAPQSSGGTQQTPDIGTGLAAGAIQGPALGLNAITGTAGTNYDSQLAQAQAAAQAQAQQSLWTQIQNEIASSGYNNQVKIA